MTKTLSSTPDADAGTDKLLAHDGKNHRQIKAALRVPSDAGSNELPRYGDKRDVAAMIGMSKRSVDNLLAQGCPHLALGKRRVRFNMVEVAQWLETNFRVQRRA